MKASVQIALKDLRQRVRDQSAIMLGLVAPLGLAFIFSLIIPSQDAFSIQLGVVDADGGPIAAAFVDDVLGSIQAEDSFLTTTALPSTEDAAAAVESGEVDAAVIVPAGFSDAVEAPTPGECGDGGCVAAELEVIGHVDRQTSAQIAEAIASSFTGRLTAVRVAFATAVVTGAGNPDDITGAAAAASPHITVAEQAASSKELSLETFFAAGMAIFFLFFTVQFGVSSLLEERTLGTMPRLLAAPIRWWHIVAGKGIAAFVLGVVAMTALIVGSTVLLGADWGDPLAVAALVVAAVLSAIGIMAVIATLAKTAEQASNWQAIVAVVLGMLGGTFFPVSQAPDFLANLSLLTPHAWFMRGLGELADGGGVGDVVSAALAMIAFFVVALAVAASRVRRMVAL